VIELQHQGKKNEEQQTKAWKPFVPVMGQKYPPSQVLQLDLCCSFAEESLLTASRWHSEEQGIELLGAVGQQRERSLAECDNRSSGFVHLK
jgi:hypothetical protein